jgi:hypothetical protein
MERRKVWRGSMIAVLAIHDLEMEKVSRMKGGVRNEREKG